MPVPACQPNILSVLKLELDSKSTYMPPVDQSMPMTQYGTVLNTVQTLPWCAMRLASNANAAAALMLLQGQEHT
jgi:hypothetical protein